MIGRIVYYGFVLPFSYLPMRVLYLFSDLFYGILYLLPYRKKVIDQNLQRSFPNKSPKELKKMRHQFYKHFCDIFIEGIKNLSCSKKELLRRFVVSNPEIMDNLYEKGKSVILVSGHFNNWEWLITSQQFLFKQQAMGIGTPLESKFWDKKVNERRMRFGMKVIHSDNFKEEIDKNREQPLAILTLSDQSPGDSLKSYWMEFLNQQTAVIFGAEQMAFTYDFAVVAFITNKVKRGYYSMDLTLIAENPHDLNWGEITEGHTRLLEQAILNYPSQWLWSHKRWKRELPNDITQLKLMQHEKFNHRFKQ
jgi:KDO2-lipid IV(A) lauroyltransferase